MKLSLSNETKSGLQSMITGFIVPFLVACGSGQGAAPAAAVRPATTTAVSTATGLYKPTGWTMPAKAVLDSNGQTQYTYTLTYIFNSNYTVNITKICNYPGYGAISAYTPFALPFSTAGAQIVNGTVIYIGMYSFTTTNLYGKSCTLTTPGTVTYNTSSIAIPASGLDSALTLN